MRPRENHLAAPKPKNSLALLHMAINHVAKTIDEFRDGLPKDIDFDRHISSAALDEGTNS